MHKYYLNQNNLTWLLDYYNWQRTGLGTGFVSEGNKDLQLSAKTTQLLLHTDKVKTTFIFNDNKLSK